MGGLIFSHLKIDGISMLPCGPAFSIPIMDVELQYVWKMEWMSESILAWKME